MEITVCTYNIHKGFSLFNRRMVIHELREGLRALAPDIVFLQEVQGLHSRHAIHHTNWPCVPQHAFLAESVWPSHAYGGNAVYDHGHHGNAILSRFPILHVENQNVSDHRFERRGLLHATLALSADPDPVLLHCFCVHLGLMAGSRRRQMAALAERIERFCPKGPLIVAGDFNDWRNEAARFLVPRLDLADIFGQTHPARSFPAGFPLLRLDRIYVRGLNVLDGQVHSGALWSRLSDHALLLARVRLDF
jgi:endonuclease/exonuclease/phosphatase family metal-dependent hydrolase